MSRPRALAAMLPLGRRLLQFLALVMRREGGHLLVGKVLQVEENGQTGVYRAPGRPFLHVDEIGRVAAAGVDEVELALGFALSVLGEELRGTPGNLRFCLIGVRQGAASFSFHTRLDHRAGRARIAGSRRAARPAQACGQDVIRLDAFDRLPPVIPHFGLGWIALFAGPFRRVAMAIVRPVEGLLREDAARGAPLAVVSIQVEHPNDRPVALVAEANPEIGVPVLRYETGRCVFAVVAPGDVSARRRADREESSCSRP